MYFLCTEKPFSTQLNGIIDSGFQNDNNFRFIDEKKTPKS